MKPVGSPPPFALSLSKGQAEFVFPFALSLSKGAFVPLAKGFSGLSPSGDKAGLRYLSPNGSLRTATFACGPKAESHVMHRGPRRARWSH
jgi:hypothetical protein